MSHKITVKYNLTLQLDGKWRLQAWTSETENITADIFVYQRKPNMPYETSARDVFVNIAQPSDISEYPSDSPNTVFPFFRLPYLDLTITDSKLVYNTLSRMALDIEQLCTALDRVE